MLLCILRRCSCSIVVFSSLFLKCTRLCCWFVFFFTSSIFLLFLLLFFFCSFVFFVVFFGVDITFTAASHRDWVGNFCVQASTICVVISVMILLMWSLCGNKFSLDSIIREIPAQTYSYIRTRMYVYMYKIGVRI